MSNGFTTRAKGKSTFQALWIGGSAQGGPGSAVLYSTAAGSNGLLVGQLGQEILSRVVASSALSIWNLSVPIPGVEKTVAIDTVQNGLFLKAAAGGSFDASTNTVIKSTYPMQIELIGVSSVAWRIVGVWPPPSTLVGGSGITLTTTT